MISKLSHESQMPTPSGRPMTVDCLERAVDIDPIEYAKKILAESEIKEAARIDRVRRYTPEPSLPTPAPSIDRTERGTYCEVVACAWLLKNGYDVFRNVSPHGPIDLVAVKEGVSLFFDVKSATTGFPSKTLEQHRLGVRILSVRPDGSCEMQPLIEGVAA